MADWKLRDTQPQFARIRSLPEQRVPENVFVMLLLAIAYLIGTRLGTYLVLLPVIMVMQVTGHSMQAFHESPGFFAFQLYLTLVSIAVTLLICRGIECRPLRTAGLTKHHCVRDYLLGAVIVGLLVFLPAGTLHYFCGWLFMGVLFIPMLVMGVFLLIKDPALLEKRLNAKEKQSEQQLVVKLSALMFLAGFILCGLDFRFQWLTLPRWMPLAAAAAFLFGYGMYAEVLRENTYLSRTIEVQKEQKVIDTGLYGLIRHPMYTATILMFVTLPLVLGSAAALPVFLLYPAIIVKRIGNEEKVLTAELKGYAEYREKVKYRLFPYLW